MKIDAQISINASYEDRIVIKVYDKSASTTFLELNLTREQWVNASMNQLAHCDVNHAEVLHPERIGKRMEMDTLIFEAPTRADAAWARDNAALYVPDGWVPDMGFGTRGSFYTKDGQRYAQTTIRRWV